MKLCVPLRMKSNLARLFVRVSKIQNGMRSGIRAREIYSRCNRGRYGTNGDLETVSVRSVPGVLVSRKSPEPIRTIIVKSNFSGSNFHLGSPGFPKLIPAPSERGEKIREQGGPVVVVPVFHPRPLHPRGHIASLSRSLRFTYLFLSLYLCFPLVPIGASSSHSSRSPLTAPFFQLFRRLCRSRGPPLGSSVSEKFR